MLAAVNLSAVGRAIKRLLSMISCLNCDICKKQVHYDYKASLWVTGFFQAGPSIHSWPCPDAFNGIVLIVIWSNKPDATTFRKCLKPASRDIYCGVCFNGLVYPDINHLMYYRSKALNPYMDLKAGLFWSQYCCILLNILYYIKVSTESACDSLWYSFVYADS